MTRLRWIFLAAVPSGLLIAVTAHISTDVAAAPLLWVLPLSLYLLTWVLVFQSRPLLPHKWMLMLQPVAIAGVIVLLAVGGEQNLLLTLGGHQLCFFVIAMACHGELARTRPAAQISHRLLCRAVVRRHGRRAVCRPDRALHVFMDRRISDPAGARGVVPAARRTSGLRGVVAWYWLVLAVLAVALIAPSYIDGRDSSTWLEDHRVWVAGAVGVLAALLALALNADRWKIFATVALALVLIRVYPADEGRVETVRSFFGVHKIVVTPGGQYHVLMHGTTIHGAEKFRNDDGTPVTGPARADHLLSQGRRHRSGDHGDPRAQGRAAAGRGDRARLRHAGLRRRARRGLEILRDRPVDGRYRARSEIFHLHPELRSRT